MIFWQEKSIFHKKRLRRFKEIWKCLKAKLCLQKKMLKNFCPILKHFKLNWRAGKKNSLQSIKSMKMKN